MTDTVDPRRIALRAEISQLFGRADAPGIGATEAQSRIAAAAALTAVLADSEPDRFNAAILAAADTDSDHTVAAHLREVAASLPKGTAALLNDLLTLSQSKCVVHTDQTGTRS